MTKLNHSPNTTILEVDGLKKYFPIRRGFLQRITGWNKAVEDVSFTIEKGNTLGLVGESGCGKTTVARLILRLLEADGGSILFKGKNITHLSDNEMKPLRREMQIIFQDPYGSLNPKMSVGQTIAEGLRIAGVKGKSELNERLEDLLKLVGMSPSVTGRFPHEFSGGQRQRIGIARALSVEPTLIICDEPVSALDVSIQAQILNLIKDLQDQLQLSYLFISHDLNVVGYVCNYVAVMYKGHIMEFAPADELFENPRHPYTHILLAAAPDPASGKQWGIKPLAGGWEGDATPQEGCIFKANCTVKAPQCEHMEGVFEKVGDEHYVRCRDVT